MRTHPSRFNIPTGTSYAKHFSPYSYKWRDSLLWVFEGNIPKTAFNHEMEEIETLLNSGHVIELNRNDCERPYSLYLEKDPDEENLLLFCLNGQTDRYHKELLIPVADFFIRRGYNIALDWDIQDIVKVEEAVFENENEIYSKINSPLGVEISFDQYGKVNYGYRREHCIVYLEGAMHSANINSF